MTEHAIERLFDTLGVLDSMDADELRRLVSGQLGNQSAKRLRLPNLNTRAKGQRSSAGQKGAARAAISRVVHRAPEVIVKVSSVAKTEGRVWSHLTYITRNGQIVAETDGEQELSGIDDIRLLHEDWAMCPRKRRANEKLTVNMVLSMPVGTNVERLTSAARTFARQAFSGHEYAFVLHTPDTDPDHDAPLHPHVHICVRSRAVNGRRLLHGPTELQAFRQLFAEKLREQGIEATATPRSVRGVVRKPKRQAIYHASRGNAQQQRSNVQLSKLREAARAVLNGENADGTWEAFATRRQEQIRREWLMLSSALETSGRPDDSILSGDIKRFVDGMPAPHTERRELMDAMKKAADKRRDIEAAHVRDASDTRSETSSGAGLKVRITRAQGRGNDDLER
ncbi:hypothetical protein QZM82_23040 [Burkholderia cepacia]|uniref:relaxase/mobilization nuclease domain-containing protein n=1 Tax=Burkholderia cepacia TaxID=292 RepID=UPI0026523A08|nr:hypothetical protein [Burkholderia cepacia]MDN7899069.1 hypothetical protein [Burkholderia cepacia]